VHTVVLLALALATAQGEDWEEGEYPPEENAKVFISAWGGEGFDVATGAGSYATIAGGEVAYALSFGDLGVAGYGYKLRNIQDTRREWTPVALLRLTNRFETRRGLEATFSVGVGAGHPVDWVAWFQIALGMRLDLGPIWLGGELAFERYNLLRLLGGVGVKF
jgi:hypothetical protein